MTKNKQNISQKQNYWWVTFKIFLSTGSRDIYNDNLIRPKLTIARAWVRGAQKGPKGAQNDQKIGKYVPKQELLVGHFQNFSKYMI